MVALRKMGKLPPVYSAKSLYLGDYTDISTLEKEVPDVVDMSAWTQAGVPMLGNDVAGDCGPAAILRILKQILAAVGIDYEPTVDDAFTIYTAITGYDPATGANDTGVNLLDVLHYMKTTGINGHTIAGYANVSIHNFGLQHIALGLFGNLYEGWALPQALQNENYPTTWAVNGRGPAWGVGSLGGHATSRTYSDRVQKITETATWNENVTVESSFRSRFQDELHVIFSNEWIESSGNAPNGFAKDKLIADMRLVGQIEG